MGCAGSKETGPPQRRLGEISSKPSSKQEGCNPHGQEPVNANIQCSKQTGTYTLGKSGFRLRYAYLSQRGYYPEDLDKNNQDAFKIIPRIDGDDSCMFMGVFDGHGADGDSCSYFVRDNIERHLRATMKEHPEDFKLAYKQAFINCNAEMHKQRFDDSMSGTTAITAFFRDGHLFVANIGDSRAIVGEDKGERVAAYTLSLDQTPYRSDERERIKAAGGAIMSCDQIEGIVPYHENWGVSLGEEIDNGGDPPRVWAPHKNYPGCAFTRSIGDSVAEGLGVFAEPELTCKEITPDDKFIVLASDGVWEFLTNQSVTDMIMKFDEPLDACRAVVAEAYRLWLQYEVRTDDITMIVAFIEEDTAATDEGRRSAQRTSSKRDNSASNLTLGFDVVERAGAENRPVRRGLSREKRQQMMLGNVNDAEEQDDGDFTPVVVPKSEREMASIQQAIKANFLFQHLNESQSKLVYDVMKRVDVQKGDVIIRQGDPGDLFYIVEAGEYAVTILRDGEQVEVMRYSTVGGTNPCFGELALMYSKPRAATVSAASEGQLWSMDRRSFRKIVMRSSATSLMKTLRSVDILKTLSVGQLQRLQEILSEVVYKDGDVVIRQGDIGHTFYLVMEGKAIVTKRAASAPPDATDETLMELSTGHYFGEKALLDRAPRAANVIAVGKLKCLSISKAAFEEVLGPLQTIIDEDSKQREKVAHTKKLRMEAEGLTTVSRDEFEPLCSGGELDLGELVVARHAPSRSEYTLRAVSKAKTVELGQQHRLMAERAILGGIMAHHTSVPLALAHFDDHAYLYTVFKLRAVADLGALLDRISVDQQSASFYLASAMAGIEFLHSEGIVYRNLSPDSLCIDGNGYLQLMDMRYAVKPAGEMLTDYCGCATYLSPEQVAGQGHGMPADFWGMGILLYEMLTGSTPWQTGGERGDSELEIYARITAHKRGDRLRLSDDLETSEHLVALLGDLLDPEPFGRIGARQRGMEELRAHPWFAGVDFEALRHGALPVPSLAREAVQAIADEAARQGSNGCLKEPAYEGDTKWFETFSSDKE